MSTVVRNKSKHEYNLKPSQKKVIDHAAKRIVKKYGKTLKLLAKE